MSDRSRVFTESLAPILSVSDFQQAVDYFRNQLLFEVEWTWGDPPSFGCVRLDAVRIFLCLDGQGGSGTWMSIFMDDVDGYFDRIAALGADVVRPPQDEPWGCREMHVRSPNGHVIRFSQGIPATEPKVRIERAALETRIEKRLLALIEDLAARKRMTLGEMLEETLLHSFEEVPQGGVASPHSKKTLSEIQSLKEKHGIDYDTHASYRFMEEKKS